MSWQVVCHVRSKSKHEVGAAGGILDGGGCCCGKGAASDGGGGAGVEERVNGGGGCWLRVSVDVLSGVRTGARRIGMGGVASAAEREDAGGGVLAACMREVSRLWKARV
ncbi:uncharacterized protein F5147DRAFT_658277 [Suillus discolor]|uniref:Uncharacterized protein n=1 Tax=Suillus discolor TaxID=1912936 RepID=A0A9P7JMB6_9AGAM|nr:uncharacterized protein F5147DRAFT_658277 [Suillus discolor]KAG2090014.1 hypothetical protein F5147DRAFT_658277 [Suillus discolor]